MALAELYRQMARSRAFEVAVEDLWNRGLVSGEMHLGTGEEAIAAGVVAHLRDGDGLALTHRCSPALVALGVPLGDMLREITGRPDGLCGGRGGHMHQMSKERLVATSGIVGASLPMGAGFALAAKRLRKGSIGVAFTGEGAMNQGMALETLNLAVAWKLPLVVVCVDNGWAITTRSEGVTGGSLAERARAFGWKVLGVDGKDVEAVHTAAGELIGSARDLKGPGFLHAMCPRLDGHLLGDLLVRVARNPLADDSKRTLGDVLSSVTASGGGGLLDRVGSMASMMGTMMRARGGPVRDGAQDPLVIARKALEKRRLAADPIDEAARIEVRTAVDAMLAGGTRG